MLAEYFALYKERHPGDLALAFVGPVSDKAPEHRDVVVTGTVSEADKWDILAAAQAMVTPSAYESFSLVLLESWTLGLPVLVNATCAATMEHCQRSGGGLWFDSFRSFEAAVDRLTSDGPLRAALGEAGRRYTARFYQWPTLIDRYTEFLTEVVARGRPMPGGRPPARAAGRRRRVRPGGVTVPEGRDGTSDDGAGRRGWGGLDRAAPDERELLAAFDRLSPEGSLLWGFDDAMRRVKPSAAETPELHPWKGLPDDLWERGRSARIGGRFVGDVAGVLAGLLADDARRTAVEAVANANVATWDALRYLAARVEQLEARTDPAGLAPSLLALPAPDVGGLLDEVIRFVWPPGERDGANGTVVLGELGDRALWDGLAARAGHDRHVRGVDPRGAVVWGSWPAAGPDIELVTAEVVSHLRTLAADSVGAVLLSGCADRVDLAAKLELVDEALRVTARGGRLVILVDDQSAWDASLAPQVRDLLPGRPLHPQTWELLLRQRGVQGRILPPDGGTISAILAVVQP